MSDSRRATDGLKCYGLLVTGTDRQLKDFALHAPFLNAIQRRGRTVHYTCLGKSDLMRAKLIAEWLAVTLEQILRGLHEETYKVLVPGLVKRKEKKRSPRRARLKLRSSSA
jgi:hypothetical protein